MAVVLLGALVGAGCGSSDDGSAAGGGATAGDKSPPVYTVTATETADGYAYDLPEEIKGGVVTIKLVSDAANKEPHDFQLVKLGDHTVADVVKQVGAEAAPLEKWMASGAGVGTIAPGASATATVDLEPGAKYAFFCTEGGENGSHAEHGMSGEFTTGDDSGASMPDTDATITAEEYSFDIAGLKAGENTIRFRNDGRMLHHVLLFPMADGATLDDIKKAFESEEEPTGPPPVDFEKGVASAAVGSGESVAYTADLEAGKYVAICFLPDYGTAGPPHAAKGMMTEVTVE